MVCVDKNGDGVGGEAWKGVERADLYGWIAVGQTPVGNFGVVLSQGLD